jgi:hypothetical protein
MEDNEYTRNLSWTDQNLLDNEYCLLYVAVQVYNKHNRLCNNPLLNYLPPL